MKILVTGGAGYIGSHTVVELYNAGFDVVVIDNLMNSEQATIDRIEQITGLKTLFEQIDLTDKQATAQCFQRHCDAKAVIHFAAAKAVGESVEKPLFYYRNNLESLINVLDNIQKQDIPHIVFSSSCTVYGQPDKLPVTEDAPIKKAESPYGNTKQICEEILFDAQKVSDLNVISLRYFNPIGAHPSALIGELPRGVPNNLMPFITQTAIGKRQMLSIFGNDYDTPDGTPIRDYIHVVDLAKAHVVAVKRMLEGQQKEKMEYFNIGTGRGYSVLEVIKSFEKTSRQKLPYEIKGRRAGDIVKIWADPQKALTDLGWQASLSLDDMTKSSWEWEKRLAEK